MSFPWARTTAPDPAERRRQAVAAVAGAARQRLPALQSRHRARQRPAPAVRPLAGPPDGARARPGPAAGRARARPRGRGRPAHAGGERPARGRAVPAGEAGGGARDRALRAGLRPVGLRGARLRTLLPRPARVDPLPARAARLPAHASAPDRAAPGAGGAWGGRRPRPRAHRAGADAARRGGGRADARSSSYVGDSDIARGGGLRGGRYRIDGRSVVHLRRPGVRAGRAGQRAGARLRHAPPARAAAVEWAGGAGGRLVSPRPACDGAAWAARGCGLCSRWARAPRLRGPSRRACPGPR